MNINQIIISSNNNNIVSLRFNSSLLLKIICILLSSKGIWTRSSFWLNENILFSLWYKSIEFYDKAKPLTLSSLLLIVFAFRCLDNGINWQSACASWRRDDGRKKEASDKYWRCYKSQHEAPWRFGLRQIFSVKENTFSNFFLWNCE